MGFPDRVRLKVEDAVFFGAEKPDAPDDRK